MHGEDDHLEASYEDRFHVQDDDRPDLDDDHAEGDEDA